MSKLSFEEFCATKRHSVVSSETDDEYTSFLYVNGDEEGQQVIIYADCCHIYRDESIGKFILCISNQEWLTDLQDPEGYKELERELYDYYANYQ